MSMASDISTISSSLNAIKNAIIDKGVTPTGDITTYADAISQISGTSTELTTGTYTIPSVNGNPTYTLVITSGDGIDLLAYDSNTRTITITRPISPE